MQKQAYDAVVVGSGPNGLAAAICLQQAGLSVLLIEGRETVGGGMRSAALTLPGFTHDICSAIHPLAVQSPFFKNLPLHQHGLEYISPPLAAAHPLDDGQAALLHPSLEITAEALQEDGHLYRELLKPVVDNWDALAPALLGPLRWPEHPLKLASFGFKALLPAAYAARNFKTEQAKALWAGMAAHAMLPLSKISTSSIALVLMGLAHKGNWPIPKGGAQAIATSLASYFQALGGEIQCGWWVESVEELPPAKAILFDVSPRQLLTLAGHRLSAFYRWQLNRYRYGMGVFKIDWALDGPIPFLAEACRKAGTVHLGGTIEEIARSEADSWRGRHPEKPFVLLAQQSLFDGSRAPKGKHTAWAYCHVPHGSEKDMTMAIEQQVERYAPGFSKLILARHTYTAREMEAYNPNYVGGDINNGVLDITQLFSRPALRKNPYATSAQEIFLCSSATPPGGGVHGMCGYHAAKTALQNVFGIRE